MSVRGERVRLPAAATSLGAALREGRADARRFLRAIPASAEEWLAALPEARAPAPGLGRALAARQEALGAGARAVANARALEDAGVLAVVAGQQPGLLGGPLLAVHKAAAVVRLAADLEARLSRRVVPLFWSAADDHDLDEMRSVWVVDGSGQARRVTLRVDGGGRSASDVPVPPGEAEAVARELEEALPRTERAREARAALPPGGGRDFARWSAECLAHWLGDSGAVIVEPAVLAPFSGPVLSRLLERGPDVARAVAESGRALRAAGFPAPVEPAEDEPPLFLRAGPGGPRLRVRVAGRTVAARRGEANERSLEAVARAIREDPRTASADVVGRVLLQDALFPVAAFLAGPTEIAYVAQTRPAHDLLGIPFPPVLPRAEAVWLDERTERAIDAFGLSTADVLAGAEPSDDGGSPRVDDLTAPLRREIERALDAARSAEDGEGAAALRRALERLSSEWAKSEARVREAFAADAGVGRARWARARNALFPGGRPQERVLSPLSLVARHGLPALREGLRHLDPLATGVVLLHLQEPEAS